MEKQMSFQQLTTVVGMPSSITSLSGPGTVRRDFHKFNTTAAAILYKPDVNLASVIPP